MATRQDRIGLERLRGASPRLFDAVTRMVACVRELAPEPGYRENAPRVFLVGGFVRDELIGRVSKDVDLEVYGIAPERLETALADAFPGKMNVVGRAFGILKIFVEEGIDLDIAIPRRESKSGAGHKGFAISGDPLMAPQDALRRRDFTVNAIAADAVTGELVDPFGGAEDLRARILRVVDPRTFPDDPLRVYRALQLAARLELTVEPETIELMRGMVSRGDLAELSNERITEEIKKLLLKSARPSVGFVLARELGIIERDYPELHALIGTEQEKEWHPEGDVWIHSLMVIDQAAKIIRRPDAAFSEAEKIQVILGSLCHDLGKPPTTKVIGGRIRSRGHEEAGVAPTTSLLGRWTFGADALHACLAVVQDHLKPTMLYLSREKGELSDEQYVNAVRRLLKRIAPMSWQVFLAAAEADSRGRAFPDADTGPYPQGRLFRETVEKLQQDGEAMKSLLQGRDLLELGVAPGPDMGKIIEAVEEARDRGEIKTKEEAIELVKRLRS
ncbi:HD domain-containing protein [Candidatus Uhrbacteria bacterium]|nr:HD domain-containing protein [Candidatus Uhrbacteria bacterium]